MKINKAKKDENFHRLYNNIQLARRSLIMGGGLNGFSNGGAIVTIWQCDYYKKGIFTSSVNQHGHCW